MTQTNRNQLTDSDREALKLLAARLRMAGFVCSIRPEYVWGWVQGEICEKLDRFFDDVRNKRSPRLIITMPPRSGKSELVSRIFPAFAFGQNPDLAVIACSYSSDLSTRFNRDVQRIIDSREYADIFPQTRLTTKNSNSASEGAYTRTTDLFEIVGHKGVYRSAGVGGGITGQGADILIVDDPFKDRSEADSVKTRAGVWNWFTSTAYTRLSPGGGAIVMCTRWHTDDLVGRLLKEEAEGGEHWDLIRYQAIATQDEEHRRKGEALHPQRYPLEALLKIKKAVGSRDWESLYQQNPVPEEGAVFKAEWIRRYNAKTLPVEFDSLVMSWDMAFKEKTDSDFVCGQVWGRSGSSYYLLDQVHDRMDFVRTLECVVQFLQKHPRCLAKLVEDKANGPAILSALRGKVPGLIPINPKDSKLARAYAVTPFFEAGNVYIPEDNMYPWVSGYVNELLNFPSVPHDDRVDATTQALNYFKDSGLDEWMRLGSNDYDE